MIDHRSEAGSLADGMVDDRGQCDVERWRYTYALNVSMYELAETHVEIERRKEGNGLTAGVLICMEDS